MMITDDKIGDEKVQYKYEFLTAEEIPSDQRRRIEQALKSLKSEENQELESIEGPFQKR